MFSDTCFVYIQSHLRDCRLVVYFPSYLLYGLFEIRTSRYRPALLRARASIFEIDLPVRSLRRCFISGTSVHGRNSYFNSL